MAAQGSTSDCKMFSITLLMMCYFFNSCNTETFESLSQNFCLNLGGVEDNLSCPDVSEGMGNCFSRGSLCDGVWDCSSGLDEGESLMNLMCGEYFIIIC